MAGAAALLTLVTASCAPTLASPPRLVAAWPTAGMSLSVAGHTFDLIFNHPLEANTSTASISREDNGKPLPTEVTVSPGDPRRLEVKLLESSEGSYVLHWHAVSARVHAASDGDHTFTLRKDAALPPRLEVSPARVDVGEAVDLVGRGFAKRTTLKLTMGDDKQPLAGIETDANGEFHLQVGLPETVPLGMQPLTAVDGQGHTASSAVQVHWGGWPPAITTNVGEPGPGPGEVTFVVNVRNRSDYLLEHLRVVLQDPEGATLVSAEPGGLRQAGTLEWVIPVMDRGVVGPFRATYRTGDAVVGHTWLEFRHRHRQICTQEDCLPAFISNSASESLLIAPVPASPGTAAAPTR